MSKPMKHAGRQTKGRWGRCEEHSAGGVVCNIFHGVELATSAFSALFSAALVYPQHRLWYHCSRTIGSTLRAADRASCQILNNPPRPSTPTSPVVKLALLLWLLQLLLHSRAQIFLGLISASDTRRPFTVSQFKMFFFHTCIPVLRIKVTFPVFFSLWPTLSLHYAQSLQLCLLVLVLKYLKNTTTFRHFKHFHVKSVALTPSPVQMDSSCSTARTLRSERAYRACVPWWLTDWQN